MFQSINFKATRELLHKLFKKYKKVIIERDEIYAQPPHRHDSPPLWNILRSMDSEYNKEGWPKSLMSCGSGALARGDRAQYDSRIIKFATGVYFANVALPDVLDDTTLQLAIDLQSKILGLEEAIWIPWCIHGGKDVCNGKCFDRWQAWP